MSQDYTYNSSDLAALQVNNGEDAVAADVNTVWQITDEKLTKITNDNAVQETLSIAAYHWATDSRGTEPDSTTYPGEYSSRAWSIESKSWATSAGVILLANGSTSAEPSAKVSAAAADADATSTAADAVSTAADAVSTDADATATAADVVLAEYWAGIALAAVKSPGKNILINSNFEVNQEGYVASASLADGEYAHDMWKSLGATSGYSWSSDLVRVITMDTTSEYLEHVSEELLLWNGETVTCSLESGALNIADKGGGVGTVTASTPVTFTLDVNSANGLKIYKSGTNFSGLKLEGGSVATPYEKERLDETETTCHKYFEVIAPNSAAQPIANGYFKSSTEAYGTISFLSKPPIGITVASTGTFVLDNTGSDESGTLTFSATGNSTTVKWKMTGTGYPTGEGCILITTTSNERVTIDSRY